MTPIIERRFGHWYCVPCKLSIVGKQDAVVHLRTHHDVPPEYVAFDEHGNVYDIRSISTPEMLRGLGGI